MEDLSTVLLVILVLGGGLLLYKMSWKIRLIKGTPVEFYEERQGEYFDGIS